MKGRIFHGAGVVILAAILLAGCAKDESPITGEQRAVPNAPMSGMKKGGGEALVTDAPAGAVVLLDELNAILEAENKNFRVGVMEYVTADGSGEYGTTVIAKDVGNKQLGHHFVPRDPRRQGRTDITYITDYRDGAATGPLNADETTFEIDRAMAVWNDQKCSRDLTITNLGAVNLDLGVVQFFRGFGGLGGFIGDVTHAGWLPKAFFDSLVPGGGSFILGVTFTFIWVSSGGPTDIDNNGKLDVAFREIYYNNNFRWRLGPHTGGNDFQAFGVILHEAGHGLSQGHFGKVFRKDDGSIQFAPQAVMNAVVGRSITVSGLAGTDNGGHCSIWGSWPNN